MPSVLIDARVMPRSVVPVISAGGRATPRLSFWNGIGDSPRYTSRGRIGKEEAVGRTSGCLVQVIKDFEAESRASGQHVEMEIPLLRAFSQYRFRTKLCNPPS
jgi:hypothetical protein